MNRTVGIDFDNTIASYDALFMKLARKHGFVPPDFQGGKRELRDMIQSRRGDLEWQALQGEAYGPEMGGAELIPGVRDFISACRKNGLRVVIVSHKSEYAGVDPTRTPLRVAALEWMRNHGFFSGDGLGFTENDVFFESTRAEKVVRIGELRCDWFIDDLEEVFAEPVFPPNIQKILFRPGCSTAYEGVKICANWEEILLTVEEGESKLIALKNVVEVFFEKSPSSILPIYAGRNSRVFHVRFPHGDEVIAKWYFRDRSDLRNRLETEYAAYERLWRSGFRNIPKPSGIAREAGIAFYGFVHGKRLSLESRHAGHLDQAASFIASLPRPSSSDAPASEATFSWNALQENIRTRRAGLAKSVRGDGPLVQELSSFLSEWDAAYSRFEEKGRKILAKDGVSIDEEIPVEERILSPSDFGFHNAIEGKDGQLTFLDFEYFGVDDPVKALSDFALHPAMELSPADRDRFWEKLIPHLPEKESLRGRLRASYPIYGLKWCLILLNEFLASQLERREFASCRRSDLEALRSKQLAKARSLLHKLGNDDHSF